MSANENILREPTKEKNRMLVPTAVERGVANIIVFGLLWQDDYGKPEEQTEIEAAFNWLMENLRNSNGKRVFVDEGEHCVSQKCREAGFRPGHIFDLTPPTFSKQSALEDAARFQDAAKEPGYYDLPKLPGERD